MIKTEEVIRLSNRNRIGRGNYTDTEYKREYGEDAKERRKESGSESTQSHGIPVVVIAHPAGTWPKIRLPKIFVRRSKLENLSILKQEDDHAPLSPAKNPVSAALRIVPLPTRQPWTSLVNSQPRTPVMRDGIALHFALAKKKDQAVAVGLKRRQKCTHVPGRRSRTAEALDVRFRSKCASIFSVWTKGRRFPHRATPISYSFPIKLDPSQYQGLNIGASRDVKDDRGRRRDGRIRGFLALYQKRVVDCRGPHLTVHPGTRGNARLTSDSYIRIDPM